MQLAIIIFLITLLYAWVGYPLLLLMATRLFGRQHHPASAGAPSCAVIIAAHNEEQVIAARVENLLSDMERYPGSCVIHLGLDGSDDGSLAVLDRFAGDDRIVIHNFEQRRGKVAVLKDLVRIASERNDPEVLLFTDANTFFCGDALQRLVSHFPDPDVGGVCGKLLLVEGARDWRPSTGSEGIYWRMESWMKEVESSLDSSLGANGAIYAIRTDLFWSDLPGNTIVDDLVIGMKVRERGKRMVYEREAIATEDIPDQDAEWRRRIRIGAGDYQALTLCWRSLLPRYGWFAWSFFSHKVLRWFTPHMLVIMFLLSFGVIARGDVSVVAGVVVAGTGLALALAALYRAGRSRGISDHGLWRILSLVSHFVTMQAALFAGFMMYCRGNLSGAWQRTPREGRR